LELILSEQMIPIKIKFMVLTYGTKTGTEAEQAAKAN